MEYVFNTLQQSLPFRQQLGFFAKSIVINNNTACQWLHIKGSFETWIKPGQLQVQIPLPTQSQIADIDGRQPPGVVKCNTIRVGEYIEAVWSDQVIQPSPGYNLSGSSGPSGGDVSGTIDLSSTSTLTVIGWQGNPIQSGPPADAQLYLWNSLNSDWELVNLSGAGTLNHSGVLTVNGRILQLFLVDGAGNITASTNIYATMSDMTQAITTTGGTIAAWLTASILNDTNAADTSMALALDGNIEQGQVDFVQPGANFQQTITTFTTWKPAAGAHTVRGRWKAGVGQNITSANGNRHLMVMEIRV